MQSGHRVLAPYLPLELFLQFALLCALLLFFRCRHKRERRITMSDRNKKDAYANAAANAIVVVVVVLLIGGIGVIAWSTHRTADLNRQKLIHCAESNDIADCLCWVEGDCKEED